MALTFESPILKIVPKMDSGLDRPQSALARGVQITELSDGCVNPEPIIMEESDILMEQYLSPTKLQLLSGSENLEDVETLELKVDTSETTLNNFGAMLPSLRVLKLSGSVIPNVRDLGSSLRNLEVLWMSRCGLEEVDGISSMLNLRELYLSYNDISDISPLTMLEELQILDLEGNNIDDIGQVHYLALCPKLVRLTLDGNPVCVAPSPEAEEATYDYRTAVKKVLPSLQTLDDRPVTETECSSPQNVFEADWTYLEELQRETVLTMIEEKDKDTAGRPATADLRPLTSYRPGSALKPSSAMRPGSSARRPASIGGGRPSSAWTENGKQRPASSDAVEGMESASELTCGIVVCGNPSKALRARRRGSSSHDSEQSESGSPLKHLSHSESLASAKTEEKGRSPTGKAENVEPVENSRIPIEEKDLSDLLKELVSWKRDHEIRLEKIRQTKAPQVLAIDHDALDPENDSDLSDRDDMEPRSDSDLSEREEMKLQPVFVIEHDHRQQGDKNREKRRSTEAGHPAAGLSAFSEAYQTFTPGVSSAKEDGIYRDEAMDLAAAAGQSQKLGAYEESLDVDEKLLKEYERLREISRRYKGEPIPSSRSPRELSLKEVRAPSPRPPSPHRSSKPFPLVAGPEAALRLGQDSILAKETRPRKVRIGPTGLPGSSQSQQPQIRDLLTPPGKTGLASLGTLISHTTHRPPSTTTLQHRIRRTLQEVAPLPSRPPPITKS